MNVCVYMGRITDELLIGETNGGNAVLNFSVATKKKNGATDGNDCDFLPCVAYGETAKFLCRNVDKGCRVLLRCRNTSQTYIDKETNKRVYKTVSLVDEVEPIDFKDNRENANSEQ